MDGRICLGFLAAGLLLGGNGCVSSQTATTVPPDKTPTAIAAAQIANASTPAAASSSSSTTTLIKPDAAPWPKMDRDPNHKHDPLPGTEVAFGKMKEEQADSAQFKNDPETQARLRDDARHAYQKALKLDPNHFDAMRCLGRLYVKMKDTDRALEIYKKAMVKHAKESGLWYDLGLCHLRRKDFAESARAFGKALELDPENRDYQKMLGLTLAWVGQIDQALTLLTRGHQNAPLAHYDIARVLEQKNQLELAKHHLRLALAENSQLEAAREMLADLDGPIAAPAARRQFALDAPQ